FNPVANTEFTINATGWPASLAVGNNASFSIAFDPTANGIQNGVIEFTHNDAAAGSPFVINVTGVGVSPTVEVREGSTTGTVVASSDAVVAAGGRDLGSIDVSAGATATKTIVILNTGAATMTLGTPTMAGIHAADFILNTTGMSLSLAPAADTSFTVAFDPTLGGIKDAQIEFTHDDTSAPSPYILPVQGIATDPTGVLISTSSLPTGASGVVYPTTSLTAIQGTAPYAWSLYSGILPTGLSISPAGVISGTPSTLVTTVYTFTVRVTDSTSATNERQFTVTVAGSLLVGGGGGGGGGCSAGSGHSSSTVWFGLLSILAIGTLVYRRRETA
ncbi:MAG: choice-of-anchor D domain-containing protein, partial [Planctomycetota bacterium]